MGASDVAAESLKRKAAAETPGPPGPYDQLLALPETLTGEIIQGRLYTQPRPSGRHGLAESALNVRIGGAFGFGDRPGVGC